MEYREVNRLRRLCTVQGYRAVGWYGRLLCGRHLPLSQLHLESAAEFCWTWNTSISFPTPPINGFTYTISKGFVKIWIQKNSLSRKLYKLNYLRTTWQPPAVPPATSSQPTLIRPVSGSIARDRTRSFTVNLIAFSGETPCIVGHQVEPVDTFYQYLQQAVGRDLCKIPKNLHCGRSSWHNLYYFCRAFGQQLLTVDFACCGKNKLSTW